MKSPDTSFGAVVFKEEEGERLFLLVHHASGNHWDHPKGHPEEGETPRDTAAREIREEAGSRVEFLEDFSVRTGWVLPDGRPKEVTYFLARHIGDVPAGGPEGEILGTRWLPEAGALAAITYDTGRDVLREAAEHLSRRASGCGSD